MERTIHCAWLIRCGEAPKADQKLTISDGLLQEIVDVPPDERSLIRPIAILPGLVNAHTHLEFSNLTTPLPPPRPFPDWIGSVVQHRREHLADDAAIQAAVSAGLQECRAGGTSVIGEICTSDAGQATLQNAIGFGEASDAGLLAVCFRELIGFTSNRIAKLQRQADQFLSSFDMPDEPSRTVLPGLSPHAPYSVHPDVVSHTCQLAKQHNIPVAMHLAETRDELHFVESNSGRFVDFLDRLGLWQPESLNGISGLSDYLAMLSECPNALAVHGNYFNSSDIELLSRSPNVTTVYCVRTHEWFGHSRHPWQQIEAAGGRVILGTDSRASNPDLSILKELQRFCQLNPAESLIERLPMISTNSAAALSLDSSTVNLCIEQPFRATCVEIEATTETNLETALMQAVSVERAVETL